MDQRAKDAYFRMVRMAVDLHAGEQPCNLSPEAQAVRAVLLKWIYKTAGNGDITDGLAAAVGKFEGSFARLCLVFHAAECAHAGMPVIAQEVSEATALRVQALILQLFYPHAARFYRDLIPAGRYTKLPQLVAGYILGTGTKRLTSTALWRHLSAWRQISPRDRRDAIQGLCEAGWLRERSKTIHEVNPAAHQAFSVQAGIEAARREHYAALLAEKLGRTRTAGED